MLTESQTPLPLVRQWTDLIPHLWEDFDTAADMIRREADPRVAAEPELSAALSIITATTPPHAASRAATAQAVFDLYCCAVWRRHKVVYSFDPDLAAELVRQADEWDDTSALPIEALLHPPYQCCYIAAPGAVDPNFIGFFPYIVRAIVTDGEPVLALTAVYKEGDELGAHTELFHLAGTTVGDCIEQTYRTARRVPHDADGEVNFDKQTNLRLLNLYLYICAQNADVAQAPAPTYRPRKAGAPIRDRYREVQSYDTGIIIGSALRKAAAVQRAAPSSGEPTGRHVRAHTRRGHWHHFWTGRKSSPEERKLVLKWVAPALVGGKDDPEITTIHPVK